MLKITVDTKGANPRDVAYLVQDIASKMLRGYTEGVVTDFNNNQIGEWSC